MWPKALCHRHRTFPTPWKTAEKAERPTFTGSLTKATLLKPALAASASISATERSAMFWSARR
jgi:hypothetical protein